MSLHDPSTMGASPPNPRSGLRVESELGWLRRVLVCSPGEELRRVPPAERDRYLVEDLLWAPRAAEQHAAFVQALATLMEAAPQNGGCPAPQVVDLRAELRRALSRTTPEQQRVLLEEVCRHEPLLRHADREEIEALVTQLWARGELLGEELIAGVISPSLAAGHELFRICPSPNVVFARDYQLVLGGGVIASSMTREVRRKEPSLSRFVFEHALGISGLEMDRLDLSARALSRLDPFPGELFVEGGDVMALDGRTVLVGLSERTSRRGAAALALLLRLLRARDPAAFPFTELCAVEMPDRRAMMHLDTVFTLVDHGLALAYPPLTFPGAREEMAVRACDLTLDPEAPLRFEPAGPFSVAMARRLSRPGRPLTLVAGGGADRAFQHREQWCDGCNAFAVGPGVAVSYDRNDRTLSALASLGRGGDALAVTPGGEAPSDHLRPFRVVHSSRLDAGDARTLVRGGERVMVSIDGGELGRARGGPHCMTMALYRDREVAP